MTRFQQHGVALAALLGLASLTNAHAARLQIVATGTAVDVLTQSATIDGVVASRSATGGLLDASGADTLLLSDFQAFGPSTQAGASVIDGYSHLVAIDASGASTSLTMDASHFWQASGSGHIEAFEFTQSLSLDGLTLRVVADAGETLGQSVTVSFSGLADFLLNGAAGTHGLALSLDVLRGGDTVASHLGLQTGSASESVNLSFAGVVGDEFTVLLSAFQSTLLPQPVTLAGATEFASNVMLQGQFTVTAVPEPASWGLGLGGLLVAGLLARGRRGQRIGLLA